MSCEFVRFESKKERSISTVVFTRQIPVVFPFSTNSKKLIPRFEYAETRTKNLLVANAVLLCSFERKGDT